MIYYCSEDLHVTYIVHVGLSLRFQVARYYTIFQLVLLLSSSHILLAPGHFLLVLQSSYAPFSRLTCRKSLKFSFIHFGPSKLLNFDQGTFSNLPKNFGKYQFEANRTKISIEKMKVRYGLSNKFS